MNHRKNVQMHSEVRAALRAGRPVVALETAVVSAGLPATAAGPLHDAMLDGLPTAACAAVRNGWRDDRPVNLELGRAMQRVVQASGAVPATIGVLEGVLQIGMNDAQLQQLADVNSEHGQRASSNRTHGNDAVAKASSGTLAIALARGFNAGTTVSATLIGCRIAGSADMAGVPIRVFATGGIGGVHRDWSRRLDVSADLVELARTPVAVVCSGCKSLLDVAATVEALEMLGVPVLGYRTNVFPQFFARGDESIAVAANIEDCDAIGQLSHVHWNELNNPSALLLCQPAGESTLLDAQWIAELTELAEQAADSAGVGGAGRTPFVLDRMAALSEGRTLQANLALLLRNASLAAEVALALH